MRLSIKAQFSVELGARKREGPHRPDPDEYRSPFSTTDSVTERDYMAPLAFGFTSPYWDAGE